MSKVKIAVIGIALVAIAIVGGTWLYINVIRDDAPERLSLDTNTTTTTDPNVEPVTDVNRVWKIGSGSQVGYRVKEILFGQSAEGVGRTSDVTGTMTIENSSVTTAEFTADMTTVKSDDTRRDNQFKDRIMSVDEFPTSKFVLTNAIDVGEIPAIGQERTYDVTGQLTAHGVTKDVSFELKARRDAASIAVTGSIPITFADYGIPNPSSGPADTEDKGEMEFLLTFVPQ